jgi:phosphoserine phosphatase RsbX
MILQYTRNLEKVRQSPSPNGYIDMTTQLKRIKYDVIYEALAGEIECGDQYLIKETDDRTVIAVVDGLGHGEEAAIAAKKAIKTIDDYANESIESLFKLCNEALLDTRGAAMTIVHIDANYKLTYMAVGNVTGVCWKIDESGNVMHHSFLLEGGIVGYRFTSSIRAKELAVGPGDTLILATDGIKAEFEIEPPKLEPPDRLAKTLFDTYRNKKDDGLIFVAKLL